MTRRCTPSLLIQMLPLALSFRTCASRRAIPLTSPPAFASSLLPSRLARPRRSTNIMHSSSSSTAKNTLLQTLEDQDEEEQFLSPWAQELKTPASKGYTSRFRQHVNPLSRRYQMPTELPDNWPYSDFTDVNAPLYLDIGCGKGGFLLELVGRRHGWKRGGAEGQEDHNIRDDTYMNSTKTFEDTTSSWLPGRMNYLGLEIRPGASRYSRASCAPLLAPRLRSTRTCTWPTCAVGCRWPSPSRGSSRSRRRPSG